MAVTLLTALCSTPTAPFVEDRVVRFVERFVSARPKLKLRRDEHGNLLIDLPAKSRGPRWVFAAHMDHPGFVARRMRDDKTLLADFRGSVRTDYLRGSRVRFFDGEREITGTVIQATGDKERPEYAAEAILRVRDRVPANALGMFDQGEGRTQGNRFSCRCIDDLGGAAAALAMIDELLARPARVPVAVLLTRAEEVGFIGAIAASVKPRLLKKTDRLIAIECSAMQPYAPQGEGAIIRVGDRTSVFNSDLTYFLTHQAEELSKKDKGFRHQRALMPGGTCEATVYDIYGFIAASICVPLGNYHNMDARRKKIGPEYIDLRDWKNMVKLFVQLARHGHEYQPGHKLLKQRVEKRFEKLRRLL